MAGDKEGFFELQKYKEALGKDYERIQSSYVCFNITLRLRVYKLQKDKINWSQLMQNLLQSNYDSIKVAVHFMKAFDRKFS